MQLDGDVRFRKACGRRAVGRSDSRSSRVATRNAVARSVALDAVAAARVLNLGSAVAALPQLADVGSWLLVVSASGAVAARLRRAIDGWCDGHRQTAPSDRHRHNHVGKLPRYIGSIKVV